MPKNKSHKGTLKRIRITRTGFVKHKSGWSGHLKSHKSGKRLRRLRHSRFMSNPEAKRLERLLFRRLRGRDQPRAAFRRSPAPGERARAAASADSQD